MGLRDAGGVGLGAIGIGMLLLPGRGLMTPAMWFGPPQVGVIISMALIIFCVVYFGTLQFWKMLTGDSLQKPLPGLLALFLAIRLTVDCAHLFMWR